MALRWMERRDLMFGGCTGLDFLTPRDFGADRFCTGGIRAAAFTSGDNDAAPHGFVPRRECSLHPQN